MKMRFISFILLLLCQQATLYSQESSNPKTRTEDMFTIPYVNHRHVVLLKKNNRVQIEMNDLDDYSFLSNIDSLLSRVRDALNFYKDSLQISAIENVRIDYLMAVNDNFKMNDYRRVRVKKYKADGDLFIEKDGEVSRLKIEQDTVNILIKKWNKYQKRHSSYHPVKITLLLNDYSDIDQIIQGKNLQHFIDTMQMVSSTKHKTKNSYWNQTTIFYNTVDAGRNRFTLRTGLIKLDNSIYYKSHSWGLNFDIGAGLVTDKLSPTADIGIEYRFKGVRNEQQLALNIYAAPYFLFEKKGDGSNSIFDNCFINAEFGVVTTGNRKNVTFVRGTMGIGYLANPDGIHFKNTCMKAFFNYTFKSNICISPEILFTDNFHTLFPGFTFKYYLNSFLDD